MLGLGQFARLQAMHSSTVTCMWCANAEAGPATGFCVVSCSRLSSAEGLIALHEGCSCSCSQICMSAVLRPLLFAVACCMAVAITGGHAMATLVHQNGARACASRMQAAQHARAQL